MKILPTDFASHPDRLSRFVQEAKAASALNHPNIITIHEIDGKSPSASFERSFGISQTVRELNNLFGRLRERCEARRPLSLQYGWMTVAGDGLSRQY